MSMSADQDGIRPATLQGQIIVGALVAGLVTFLAIAAAINLVLKPGAPAGGGVEAQGAAATQSPLPVITYLAVATAAVSLPVSFVAPILVTRQQRRLMASEKMTTNSGPAPTPAVRSLAASAPLRGLPAVFLTQLIIGAAINEGAAFFALVAYLIESKSIALATAVVLIAGVIARIPTAGRVERWIEQQRDKLREDQLDSLSSY